MQNYNPSDMSQSDLGAINDHEKLWKKNDNVYSQLITSQGSIDQKLLDMSINKDDAFRTIRASYQNSDIKHTSPQSSATKEEDDEVNLGCDDNNMSTLNEDKMSIDSDQLLKNVKKKFTTINQYDSDKSLDKPEPKIETPDKNCESNDDV